MKKTILFILFVIIFSNYSFATKRIITVQNFSFSPSSLNANVGDTIQWNWISGSHTTTSTSVPLGAASWDSPLSSSNTSFMYRITVAGTYNYKCTPHESMGMVGSFVASSSLITQTETTVSSFELKQNYPNPFNPTTTINFSIPKSENVKISVFNVLGKEVEVLNDGKLDQGSYKILFDASKYSSGVYFYKIAAGEFTEIKKMLLVK